MIPASKDREARGPADHRVAGTPGRGRRRVLIGIGAALIAAGIAVAVAEVSASTARPASGAADNSAPVSLATVTRRSLSSQQQVTATLGYAGDMTVISQATGTITGLPLPGQVVHQGQVLYQVSGDPVVLLSGATPAYRSLSEGMTGPDVTELNTDLVKLGYATSSEVAPGSSYFGWQTAYALEKLQAALGVTQTGTLALGQAVFLPAAARVTSLSATLGAPAQPGATVLTATSTTRQVSIDLDAAQQTEVKAGDKVTITLPGNQTTPGVISSIGTVATTGSAGSGSGSGSSASGSGSGSGSGTPTITVLVTPADPAATGSWDQAPVTVTITTATVRDALVVPVDALLALGGGGYAVEVAGAGGHHLVPVSPGLFDDADGLVQVTGSSLAAGQKLVVPAP
jgi:hypothetical protein